MSDIVEATEDRIERDVAGTLRAFVFLNSYDRAEILRADLAARKTARAERKKKLVENLQLAGITGEQMFTELEAFDDKDPESVTEQDWWTWFNSPLNDVEIYRLSLAKTYKDEAGEIAKQANLPLIDRGKICGIAFTVKAQDDDANPRMPVEPIPPTYPASPSIQEMNSIGDGQSPESKATAA